MPRFDMPRDRESIEDLKHIYFLSNMNFYEPLEPYFDPENQTIVLHPEDCEPELFPGFIPVYNLFAIPDDHPLEKSLMWDEKIDNPKVHGQLKESIELLKSLDSTIVDPHKAVHGRAMYESLAWQYRITHFLKGGFEMLITAQENLILDFIQLCLAEHYIELDKFYVPFVEV